MTAAQSVPTTRMLLPSYCRSPITSRIGERKVHASVPQEQAAPVAAPGARLAERLSSREARRGTADAPHSSVSTVTDDNAMHKSAKRPSQNSEANADEAEVTYVPPIQSQSANFTRRCFIGQARSAAPLPRDAQA